MKLEVEILGQINRPIMVVEAPLAMDFLMSDCEIWQCAKITQFKNQVESATILLNFFLQIHPVPNLARMMIADDIVARSTLIVTMRR